MNYFMSVNSAQWILIEVGVLMQIVAIIAVYKQRAGARMLPPHSPADAEFRSRRDENSDPAR